MNTYERETVPEWARAQEANAPDPNAWTERQRAFVFSLIEERDLTKLTEEQQKCLDDNNLVLTKAQASRVIEKLLTLPKKPKDKPSPGDSLALLPPGRYALPKTGTKEEDNELRFYQCWESKDKQAKRLYVQFGPYESKLPYAAQQAIARKILLAGVRECALRWGAEIGTCSNCGRRLTNRISRELAIGPICGGRVFGDDFKLEVKTARERIKARGEDPDEEME